jgi:hypothetical protein
MNQKHCRGCHDDFYNGHNDLGVVECWHLKKAKIVWKKRVGMWQLPPWKQKAVRVPDCKHEDGYVFVGPKHEH